MRNQVASIGTVTAMTVGALAVGLSASFAQAARNPFVGTWDLDVVKSTFSAAAPRSRVIVFEAVDNGVKQIMTTYDAGGASDQNEYTARFDGKDYPLTNSVIDSVSLKRISANRIERVGKRHASGETIVERSTREVSVDGKTLTISTKGTSFDGVDYESVQVYKRRQ
jgi:hypothetical protein